MTRGPKGPPFFLPTGKTKHRRFVVDSMALPPKPNNPNIPIPNSPFTAPDTFYVAGPWFPVEVGVGVSFNTDTVKIANLSNSGVLAIASVAGTGISINDDNGYYDISNAGVLSLTPGPNISISASTGNITISASSTGVETITVNAPLVKTGTATDPILSVSSATTTAPGVVQLNNTTSSTSTTLALTAAQGKALQDQIDSLAITSNITLAGTYNANTGLVDSITVAGTAVGFAVGSALPAAAPGNADYFVIVDVQGSTGPAGTPPYHIGDWFLSNGTAWQFLNVGFQAPQASTTVEGVVTLATDAEAQAGINTTDAVVPSSLQSKLSDSTSTASSTTIASSTAVKSAYDLAAAAIPCSAITAKGALLTGTGPSTQTALGVGTDGQVLLADSSCLVGIKWGATPAVTSITAGTGLCGGTITSTGTICLDTTSVVQSSAYSAKGVILAASSGSTPTALTVGTDGQILTACSTSATGVCWAPAPASGIPCSTITAKGTLVTGTAANTPAALPVGNYGEVLLADSGCATGLKWGGLPQASVAGLGVVYGCTTTAASCNTSLGYYSLAYTSATCTIVLGNSSMIGSQGDSHIAIGVGIQATQSGSSCNVVIGNRIGGGNFQGSSLNVIVGQYAACGCLSGSNKNVILGANAGTTLNLACNNVAIGYGVAPPTSSSGCTLAIGYDTGCHWLTGDSTKAIKPGAGIIDCANSCGTAGQVLMSTGSNGVCWGTAGGGGGTPIATPTVVGTLFGCSKDTGTLATAVGYNALVGNPTGNWNVGVGSGAGQFLTSGQWNTFIGSFAGQSATTATGSVAIGINAAQISNGSGSIAIGNSAGYRSGNDNVAIGNASMTSTCTCTTRTVAIGSNTARFGSGNDNVAIGFSSACVPSCGGCNTVIGSGSLQGVGVTATTAPCNTSLGFKTLNAATTACLNVALGFAAGCSITSGAQNVLIGPNVGTTCTTETCTLAIGYSNTALWLTGDSTKAIKPGAGIIDCAGSCGTAGQVLMSNGSNAVCWGTAGGGGGSGTVTSITAGTGLTGGVITTSGTVALDTTCVIQPAAYTAKGTLLSASAASTPSALGVGTDGQILTACSACTTGLQWATVPVNPWVTYTSGALELVNGTPIEVAVWDGGSIEGTFSIQTNYNQFTQIWQVYLSGDATNLNTGWNVSYQYPASSSPYNWGNWSVDFPVYPATNANKWVIYFTPTVDLGVGNGNNITFLYRSINGNVPIWSI